MGLLKLLAAAALTASFVLSLVIALSTSLFTGTPLSGPDAMSYALIAFMAAFRAVAMLLAASSTLLLGRFAFVMLPKGLTATVVLAAILGTEIVGAAAFLLWTSPPQWFTAPAGIAGGVLLPLASQAYLASLLKAPVSGEGRGWRQAAGMLLAGVGAIAILATLIVVWVEDARSREQEIQELTDRDARVEEMAREDAARALEQARALDALTDEAPLEEFLPHLFIDKTGEHQARALQRIDRLPDLEAQVARVLTSSDPRQREYGLNYVRRTTVLREGLANAVRKSASLLEADIVKAEALYEPATQLNYQGLVRGTLLALERFPLEDFTAEIGAVRDAVAAKADDAARAETLKLLDSYLASARRS